MNQRHEMIARLAMQLYCVIAATANATLWNRIFGVTQWHNVGTVADKPVIDWCVQQAEQFLVAAERRDAMTGTTDA